MVLGFVALLSPAKAVIQIPCTPPVSPTPSGGSPGSVQAYDQPLRWLVKSAKAIVPCPISPSPISNPIPTPTPAPTPVPSVSTDSLQAQITALTQRINSLLFQVSQIETLNHRINVLQAQNDKFIQEINSLRTIVNQVLTAQSSTTSVTSLSTQPASSPQPMFIAPIPQTTTQVAPKTYTPPQNLFIGSRGSEVAMLQQFLIDKGFLKISAPTAYYGVLTRKALDDWNKAQ